MNGDDFLDFEDLRSLIDFLAVLSYHSENLSHAAFATVVHVGVGIALA